MGNCPPGAVVVMTCVITEESCKDENTACARIIMDGIIADERQCLSGPMFQTEILKGRVAQVPAKDTHVMVVPIRHAEVV